MNDDIVVGDSGEAGGDVMTVVAPVVSAGAASAKNPCGVHPRVRCREEHGISRRDIDPDALKVLYRLAKNGFTAYLVGGGVRDLLLGRRPKDFDISTDAKPEEIRALFKNCILIGRRFRLAHVRYGEKIIETSTFRRAPELAADPTDPDADLIQRDDNIFGTPEEDALRRDFTVNGLFYDIDTFSVIDYVGGIEDLAARRIRAIGDPNIRFREDPIRMVRAVRFASRLDFDFEPNTLDAIRRHRDELTKANASRLLEEIMRLFAFSSGEVAIGLMHTTGLLRVILPEVADCLDDAKVDTNRFWPRLRALDAGDTVLPEATPAVIFATLLADPLMAWAARDRRDGNPHRLRFDRVRAFLEPIAQRLRFPRKLTDRIVNVFMAQHRFAGQTGGKRNSLAGFVTQDWFHDALAMAELNLTVDGKPQSALNPWRELLAERIYDRDDHGSDNGNGRFHQPRHDVPQQAAGDGAEAGGDGEGDEVPGKKLSRSARRRRNKKRNRRLREDASCEAVAADGQAGVAASEAPVEAAPPAAHVAKQEAAVEAVPAAATPAAAGNGGEASEKRERGGRHRGRRDRARRKREAEGGGEAKPAAASEGGAAVEEASAEPFRPLTAAAFYAAPKEPEKPKAVRGRKGAKDKAAANGKAAEPEAEKEKSERKPLAMDRSEEAESPMHWLDEI